MKIYNKFLVALAFAGCLLIIAGSYQKSDNKPVIVGESQENDTIALVFAGDIMGHMPQIEAAYDKEKQKFDFSPCYRYISPYIQSADLAVANLETPLAGKPYSGYPRFSSPDELLDGPLSAGFDVMLMANNHVADRGKSGIMRSWHTVNARIKSVGVYLNQAQRDSLYPLIVDIKGFRTAILNYTYGTNGNVVPEPLVVNNIDTAQIHKDVLKARSKGARLVVMTLHWGVEYQLKANAEQERLARYFAQLGVDIVIGSHPHVVQNFEYVYKPDGTPVPVFYSLGNMISNQRQPNTNGGILAKVKVDKKSGKILSCSYMPFYVHRGILENKYQYYLIPEVKSSFKTNVVLPERDSVYQHQFYDNTRQRLSNLAEFN
jgi:poly-gamma-glutamate synthesis protein (capsule biosynthesis protein)